MTKLSKGLYDRLIHEDELAEINKLIFEGRATVKTPSYIENREYLLSDLLNRLPELLDEISISKDSSSEKNLAEIQLISTLLKNARLEAKAGLEIDFIAQPPQVLDRYMNLKCQAFTLLLVCVRLGYLVLRAVNLLYCTNFLQNYKLSIP